MYCIIKKQLVAITTEENAKFVRRLEINKNEI